MSDGDAHEGRLEPLSHAARKLAASLRHQRDRGALRFAPVERQDHAVSCGEEGVVTDQLSMLEGALRGCTRCPLHAGRRNVVFGAGDPQARLMFIGEGPGAREDEVGEPFVGPAGELLDAMIGAMGLVREDVYIANVVKCRPPGNRDPEPDEVATCSPFLIEQVRLVKPEVLVPLGRFAAQTLLRTNEPISLLRGTWTQWESVAVMPTFHPAYLLRNKSRKKEAWVDLQAVMRRLGLRRGEP